MKYKKIILLVLIALIFTLNFGFGFTANSNPFIPNNLPTNEGVRNSSDPTTITIWNDTEKKHELFLYTSCDLPAKSKDNQKIIYPMNTTYCYSTFDMINWTDRGAVITENSFSWGEPNAYSLWAPEIEYNELNKTYYLYVPLMQKLSDTGNVKKLRIGVATSSSPAGPFTALPDYFQINGSNVPNGGFAYDPGTFYDLSWGRYYMTYCDNNHPNGRLHIADMGYKFDNPDMTSADYIGQITFRSDSTVTPPSSSTYMEGPDIYPFWDKWAGGWNYYLIFAAKVNDGEPEYIGYAMATPEEFHANPAGCWNFKGWIFKDVGHGDWTNHACFADYIPEGAMKKYIFYHVGNKIGEDTNRRVCVEEFEFVHEIGGDNGSILGVTADSSLGHTDGGPWDNTASFSMMRDEATGRDKNIKSKVRMLLKNPSANAWSNFKAKYYFTTENGKTPVLNDWSSPNSTLSLLNLGSDQWAVVLDYNGYALNPGESIPEDSEDFFGLKYSDNSSFNKSNDFSQPEGNFFSLKDTISVFDGNNQYIYGTTPFKKVKSQYSSKLMTVISNAEEANIVCQDENPSWNSQDWIVEKVANNNNVRLKNLYSGKYLTVKSTAENAQVVCQSLNTGWASQEWKMIDAGNGDMRFENAWSTGKYLTVVSQTEGASILCKTLNPGWSSQRWLVNQSGK